MVSEADWIIVTARGQLDVSYQPIVALTLAMAIATGRSEISVDLDRLDSIDPDDVGLLVRARSLLHARGQHLVVRSPLPNAAVLAACTLLDPHARLEYFRGDKPESFTPTLI
jgi:anti-anti-sigma factor